MYFDANARHLPKGAKFFARGSVKSGPMFDAGLRTGMVFLCKMLDSQSKNPRISAKVNGKIVVVRGSCRLRDGMVTYQGVPSGDGFICDKSKSACEKLIGGFNNTYWKRSLTKQG